MALSPRRRRIEKIVSYRQKELDDRVSQLTAQRAKEQAVTALAEQADRALKDAEDRRRKLGAEGGGAQAFLESGEWLDATSREAVRAWARVRMEKVNTERVQQTVFSAKMKLKQAEQLQTRVTVSEQKLQDRKERRRDDEDAARIAQRRVSGARK